MTVRDVNEPYEAECESKLDDYGYILTYGTAGKVKRAGAAEYPVGVALKSTKKFDGTVASNVRIPYAKRGLVKVKLPKNGCTTNSIGIGQAVMSDSSGCAVLLTPSYATLGSFIHCIRKQVGIAAEKVTSGTKGHIKVDLTIHTLPKP